MGQGRVSTLQKEGLLWGLPPGALLVPTDVSMIPMRMQFIPRKAVPALWGKRTNSIPQAGSCAQDVPALFQTIYVLRRQIMLSNFAVDKCIWIYLLQMPQRKHVHQLSLVGWTRTQPIPACSKGASGSTVTISAVFLCVFFFPLRLFSGRNPSTSIRQISSKATTCCCS